MSETTAEKKRGPRASGITGKKSINWADQHRITIFSRDQEGSIFGVVSISKDDIMDVGYNGIKHELNVTLKSTSFQGMTTIEQVQNTKVANGKVEPINSYQLWPLLKQQGFNHTLDVREEPEMKKIWEWLNHNSEDMTWDMIMDIRKDIVSKIALAKEAAIKAAKDAEDEGKPKILSPEGEAVSSADLVAKEKEG